MTINESIKGKTKIACVIGNPIAHSVSPQIHNTISSYLGIDLAYIPFLVKKESLKEAIEGFKACSLVGFNVTIPYKNAILELLDNISEEARLIEAVNTVKNVNGKLYGYNTDCSGFKRDFAEETGTNFFDKNIVVLGAGGSSRAICVKIALEGAKGISILNRTAEKAELLAGYINKNISDIAKAFGINACEAKSRLSEADIIINTTSAGMHPHMDSMPVESGNIFSRGQIVYDLIYNPPKTKLLAEAEKAGCKIVNGLGMLIYQGIEAYEIWNDVSISKEDARIIKELFKNYL